MEIVEPVIPERTDVLWCLFEKLKDFYAQPLDGYRLLRPRWMPDISRARLHRSELSPKNTRPIRIGFRRLTFEEFCHFYESLHFSEQRERMAEYAGSPGSPAKWKPVSHGSSGPLSGTNRKAGHI